MITVAQVGCGYWGPNLLRNLTMTKGIEVKVVVEASGDRQKYVNEHYPHIKTFDKVEKILEDEGVDAVVIATPAHTHYALAKQFLQAGKHCFVEKPLAMNSTEAQELCDIAEKKSLILMVGHTFLYNAAVNYVRDRLNDGTLGKSLYIYSQRLNLGRIRQDINALWNLAPHDISIILHILGDTPISVTANGAAYIQDSIEDVVFMSMRFRSGVIAHVHVSWLDPHKVRKMTVVGDKKMIVYDDVSNYKIQIYDCGIDKKKKDVSLGDFDDFGKFQLLHRAGDVHLPKINFVEPLKEEMAHFSDCILKSEKPRTDGLHGVEVIRVLEAAMESLRNDSKEVKLR